MRKSIFTLTVLIAMTIMTYAQIPNNDFENWTTVNSYDSLIGWASTNNLSTGSFYAVTKSTDHYPATVGNYSLRIENNTALLSNFSGIGIAATGSFSEKQPAFSITGHPNSLTGYYMFFPQNGDIVRIHVHLFLNGTVVSNSVFTASNLTSNWTSFNLPFENYVSADSAHITIAASNFQGNTSQVLGNSVLYIDNLSFDNLISKIPEYDSQNTIFNLYPNPASGLVTLNIDNINKDDFSLNFYSLIGTLVKSEILTHNKRQINIRDLNNGIYIVKIKSKDYEEVQRLIIQR
jgi:hypothetical protein